MVLAVANWHTRSTGHVPKHEHEASDLKQERHQGYDEPGEPAFEQVPVVRTSRGETRRGRLAVKVIRMRDDDRVIQEDPLREPGAD